MTTYGDGLPPRLGLWLFRLSLLAYPKEIRDNWAEEMMETFRIRAGDALSILNFRRLVFFWIRELWAVLKTGVRLRVRKVGGSGSRRNPDSPKPKQRKSGILEGILADVGLALRSVRKAPGFTAAAVSILAMGIGATTIAFSALRTALLTSPPFPEVEEMVMVDMLRKSGEEEESGRWPYPMLVAFQDLEDRLIDPVAGFDDGTVTLTGMGPASRIGMEIVSPGYFDVVGMPMPLGRGFTPEEGDEAGPYHVVVVSHSFWLGQLGGDQSALDRSLQLDGEPFRVVGVAPPGFKGLGGDAELWLPLGSTVLFRPGRRAQPFNHQIWVAGRLRPGASLPAAREQMAAIYEGLSDVWPPSRYGMSARSLSEVWSNPGARNAAKLLAFGAVMVLLVACANLSGLLLTRARRRMREGAVRLALGAPRGRLIRLSLVESLVIALLGGATGMVLAAAGTRWIISAWPAGFLNSPGMGLRVVEPEALALDWPALGFTLAVVTLSALVVGIAPALRTSRGNIGEALKEGSRSTGRSGRIMGLDGRATLVGFQVSVALILLVGVGLVGESVRRLMGVDEGFQTDHLLTFNFSPPQTLPVIDYMDQNTLGERITLAAGFDDLLVERINSLPDVEMATVGCGVLSGYCAVVGVIGVDGTRFEDQPSMGVVTVQKDYFETLETPILRGRSISSQDGLDAPPVVVLSASAADTYFPGEDPIGRTIAIGFAVPGREWAEVVGVAGDVLYGRPDAEGRPVAYFSTRERRFGNIALVRTTGRPSQALRAIRNEIFSLDATVAISDVLSGDELISRSAGDRRMVLGLLGLFAGVTVLLAAVGTWGVVSYSVADRRRELSLRIALGAEGRDILGLVTRKTARTTILALVVGAGVALAGARTLESFLWEVTPSDPGAYLAGSLFLLGIVLLASWLPARKATRLDPAQALKVE